MDATLIDLVFDAPHNPFELWDLAFPQTRLLIADESYLSDTDKDLWARWMSEVLEPAVIKASEAIKAGLRACLEPRTTAAVAAAAAGINFVGGYLPTYPSGLAPAVAALIVLSAHELRARGCI